MPGAHALVVVIELNSETRHSHQKQYSSVTRISQCFPINFLFAIFVGAKIAMLTRLNVNMHPDTRWVFNTPTHISVSHNWWTMRANCKNIQRVWRWITLLECECKATTHARHITIHTISSHWNCTKLVSLLLWGKKMKLASFTAEHSTKKW